MSDKHERNQQPSPFDRARAEHPLPPELEIAARRASERSPRSDQIIRCIQLAQSLGEQAALPARLRLPPTPVARPLMILGTIAAVAAALYIMLMWNKRTPTPEHVRRADVSSLPVHSAVTQVSLVEVGYRRIEADLDRADAQLALADEAIALSAVRHDVQLTLEEFYDWSKPDH